MGGHKDTKTQTDLHQIIARIVQVHKLQLFPNSEEIITFEYLDDLVQCFSNGGTLKMCRGNWEYEQERRRKKISSLL